MATLTHPSHFDLELIGETADNLVFTGTLVGCRKMAFAHGLEVESYAGRFVATDDGRGMHLPADASNFAWCYFRDGGLIHKGRDSYCLVLPRRAWLEN